FDDATEFSNSLRYKRKKMHEEALKIIENFVSIEESGILQNIEHNNGIIVFIPQGYTLILIHENATKQLKIIKKLSELRICVLALIFNPLSKHPQNSFILFQNEIKDEIIKDNPKIDTCQILKIAGNKWNKLSEYKKSKYKLQFES
ncbi:30245_t:CDS:2, partial [Gigaspora margarita]